MGQGEMYLPAWFWYEFLNVNIWKDSVCIFGIKDFETLRLPNYYPN